MTMAMISNFLFRRSVDPATSRVVLPTQEDHFLRLPKEVVRKILQYVNNPCLTASLSRRFAELSREDTSLHDFFRFFSEHTQNQIGGKVVARLLSAPQTQREIYGKLHKELQQLGLDPVKVGLCFNNPSTYHVAESLIQAKNFCLFCSRIPGMNVAKNKLQEPEDILWQRGLCHQQFNALDITNIQYLNLKDLTLTRLPAEVGRLTYLVELTLGHNGLTALSPEIGKLLALQELYLSDNALTVLPPEIGKLLALRCLYCFNNRLRTLPEEICNLAALEVLSLGGNQLTALPPEIGKLVSLDSLSLEVNQLTALPAEIGNLVALRRLDLGNNELTALPAKIGNLVALQSLYLNNNQLSAFPVEIEHLVALERLLLGDNQLTALPEELKPFLNALEYFNMDNNPLSTPGKSITS